MIEPLAFIISAIKVFLLPSPVGPAIEALNKSSINLIVAANRLRKVTHTGDGLTGLVGSVNELGGKLDGDSRLD